MNNDYDENNRYILEDKSFVDTKTNECLNFGIKDLSRVTVQLNCLERYLNDAEQQIAELQKQLEEKEKLIERLQGVIDKLRDKNFAGKTLVEAVNAVYEPLFKNEYDKFEKLKREQNKMIMLELKKLKDFIDNNIEIENDISVLKLEEFYDNQIKELRCKNESNN